MPVCSRSQARSGGFGFGCGVGKLDARGAVPSITVSQVGEGLNMSVNSASGLPEAATSSVDGGCGDVASVAAVASFEPDIIACFVHNLSHNFWNSFPTAFPPRHTIVGRVRGDVSAFSHTVLPPHPPVAAGLVGSVHHVLDGGLAHPSFRSVMPPGGGFVLCLLYTSDAADE